MVVKEFESLRVPATFSLRSTAHYFFCTERGLTPEESNLMHRVLCVMEKPEIDDLVREGKISIGLIKPHAHEGRNLPPTDELAASTILSEITKTRLLLSIASQLTQDQAEAFYAPLKEKYQNVIKPSGISVWQSIINQITSGPLTFLLIYGQEGDAITWWRTKIGTMNGQTADPNSIRGKYALAEKLPNNLVHGSDSQQSALDELRVMRNVLASMSPWY